MRFSLTAFLFSRLFKNLNITLSTLYHRCLSLKEPNTLTSKVKHADFELLIEAWTVRLRSHVLVCVWVCVHMWRCRQHVSWSDICQSARHYPSVTCHLLTDSCRSKHVEIMIGVGKEGAWWRELWLAVWAGREVSVVSSGLQWEMLCSLMESDIQESITSAAN